MPYKNIEDRRACLRRMTKAGYYKRYYHKNKQKYRQSEIRQKEKRKIRAKKYVKKKMEINLVFRKKVYAREMARRTIPLTGKICYICGSSKQLHRHHEDYNKPLEVIILCKECHRKVHSQLSYQRGDDLGVTNVI